MAAIKNKISKGLTKDSIGDYNVYKVVDLFAEGNSATEIGSWTKMNAAGDKKDNGYYMSYFRWYKKEIFRKKIPLLKKMGRGKKNCGNKKRHRHVAKRFAAIKKDTLKNTCAAFLSSRCIPIWYKSSKGCLCLTEHYSFKLTFIKPLRIYAKIGEKKKMGLAS